MSKSLSPQQIENLVTQSQGGDEAAFATLFDHFFPKIFRYIQFRTNQDEIEDLVSDIFLKVVENIKNYQQQKNASFSAWLFRIARNQLIDSYRRKKELLGLENEEGELMFDIEDEDPTPDDMTQKSWEQEKIQEVLQKLSPIHREILELRYLSGFSNAEISHITGKNEGNVRVIQLRALREMRKHFPGE